MKKPAELRLYVRISSLLIHVHGMTRDSWASRDSGPKVGRIRNPSSRMRAAVRIQYLPGSKP